jgi:hypothetical protein
MRRVEEDVEPALWRPASGCTDLFFPLVSTSYIRRPMHMMVGEPMHYPRLSIYFNNKKNSTPKRVFSLYIDKSGI